LLYDSNGWRSHEQAIYLTRLKHPIGRLKREPSLARARTRFDKNGARRFFDQFERF
jgi:hypothetical protein